MTPTDKPMLISPDGDCWIDLSSPENGVCHISMRTYRNLEQAKRDFPKTLYGIPIVFDESMKGKYGAPKFGRFEDIGKPRRK